MENLDWELGLIESHSGLASPVPGPVEANIGVGDSTLVGDIYPFVSNELYIGMAVLSYHVTPNAQFQPFLE